MEGVDVNRWEQAGAGEQRANPTHPTHPTPLPVVLLHLQLALSIRQ